MTSPSPLRPPPRRVPAAVESVLRRAQDAERTATGAQRRVAFRLTRALIGGARMAGYATSDLAALLGTSVATVRDRGCGDGWVSADQLQLITGWPAARIRRLLERGRLSDCGVDVRGQARYRASEVIRVLGG